MFLIPNVVGVPANTVSVHIVAAIAIDTTDRNLLIGIWFLARPLVLSAARVMVNWFPGSLSMA